MQSTLLIATLWSPHGKGRVSEKTVRYVPPYRTSSFSVCFFPHFENLALEPYWATSRKVSSYSLLLQSHPPFSWGEKNLCCNPERSTDFSYLPTLVTHLAQNILSPFCHLIPNFLKIRIKSCILGSCPRCPACHSLGLFWIIDGTWLQLDVCFKVYLMSTSCLAS